MTWGHEHEFAPLDLPEGPSELFYGSVDQFVRDYLCQVYRRRIDGRNRCWAGRWWDYPEAVVRLTDLWQAWECLRADPTGLLSWWHDADYHMAVLMDPDGAFALASEGEENMAKKGEPLPYVAPPAGMFPSHKEK